MQTDVLVCDRNAPIHSGKSDDALRLLKAWT